MYFLVPYTGYTWNAIINEEVHGARPGRRAELRALFWHISLPGLLSAISWGVLQTPSLWRLPHAGVAINSASLCTEDARWAESSKVLSHGRSTHSHLIRTEDTLLSPRNLQGSKSSVSGTGVKAQMSEQKLLLAPPSLRK